MMKRILGLTLMAATLAVGVMRVSAAEGVAVGFPTAGTRLVFERTVGDQRERVEWLAVDPTSHRGREVNRLINDKGYEFYDLETGSWVLTVQEGRHSEVIPHNGQLAGPLTVGASWTTDYQYLRKDGSRAPQSRLWRVEAQESVTVPAGTFDTYRIASDDNGVAITLWYAPSIHFHVKRSTRGKANVEMELVTYEAPH